MSGSADSYAGSVSAIVGRVDAFIRGVGAEDFCTIARDIFRLQFESIESYGAYCRASGVTPETISSWLDIPAIPQSVFKSAAWLAVFPQQKASGWFETSGTTDGRPGRHFYRETNLYPTAACAGIRHFFASAEKEMPQRFLFLKESPLETPHSSLSQMFEFWHEAFGCQVKGDPFIVENGTLQTSKMKAEIAGCVEPIFLAGTALFFARLMDEVDGSCPLPPHSVIMETGGFKGRRRTISQVDFYRRLDDYFSPSITINEYGMTELFSQAYATGGEGGHGLHRPPPWMRFRVRNPETGELQEDGRVGLIEILDLANAETCLALQTEDLGWIENGLLKLVGRNTEAELRGCSLTAEGCRLKSGG